MARLNLTANTEGNNDTGQDGDFALIPDGTEVVFHMVKSEWKDTNAGTGKYLNVQYKILKGEYKGRVLFEILNLDNPNPKAVQIATQQLNQICAACDKADVEDSTELHQIPMSGVVGIQKGSNGYEDKNKIKKYSAFDGDLEDDDSVDGDVETPWS